MAEQSQLYSHFADLQSLSQEKDTILSYFTEIKKGVTELPAKVSIIQTSGSKKQVDELQKSSDVLAASTKIVEERIAKLNGSSKEFTQVLLAQTKAQKEAAQTALIESKAAEQTAKTKLAEEKARLAAAKAAEAEQRAIEKTNAARSLEGQGNNNLDVQEAIIAAKKEEEKAAIDLAKSLEAQRQAQEELNAAIESAARSGNQRAQLVSDPAPLEQTARAVVVYKDELEKLTGTLSENEALQRIYKTELAQVQAELKLMDKTTATSEKSTAKYRDKVADLTSTESRLKAESKDLAKTINNQVKEQNSAEGSLDRLRARYALLTRELDRGSIAFQKGSIGKALTAEAVQTKIAIDKLERDQLNFRGSLSNIGSAIVDTGKKAFSFIRTAANIIPGLGLSGAFLLIYEGAKGLINLFSQVEDSAKSQKIIGEVYSQAAKNVGESVAKLKVVKDVLTDLSIPEKERLKTLKQYNETADQTNKIDATQINNLQLINEKIDAQNGLILKRAISLAATAKLGEAATSFVDKRLQFDLLKNSVKNIFPEEVEQELQNFEKRFGDVFDAVQKGQTSSIESERLFNRLSKTLGLSTSKTNELLLAFRHLNEASKELNTQEGLLSPFIITDGSGGGGGGGDKSKNAKFFDDLLKMQRDAYLEISKDENKFIQDRIDARQKAFEIDKILIEGKRRIDVINAKGNTEEIKNINDLARANELKAEQDKNKDILNLQDKFTKDLVENEKKGQEIIQKAKKELSAQQEAHNKSEHEVELQDIQNRYDDELLALDRKFIKGRIKEKDFNKQKLDLQLKLQRDLLQEDINFTKDTIHLAEVRALASGKQEDIDAVAAAKSKLVSLELKFQKLLTDATIKGNSDRKEDDKKAVDERIKQMQEVADLAKNLVDIAGGIAGIGTTKELNEIQEQIDLLEQKKQKEIEVANQSIANAQDRAAAITVIEARAEAQRQQLEQRKRQAQERQARFEKAATIASIILETSLAVMRALSDRTTPSVFGRIGSAVIIGALGAARLAVAIATPIPKFAKGTMNSPEGLAEVGERGPELGIDPKGNVRLFEKHTLTYLMKGTKILPADVTKDIMHANEIERRGLMKSFTPNVSVTVPDNSEALKEQTAILKRIERKQTQFHIHNENGIESTPWFNKHFKRNA